MAGLTATPESVRPRKLSQIKDKDERRFFVEDAARTFKRFAEIKREVKQIKSNPPLLKAVKEILKQEIADTKKAMNT